MYTISYFSIIISTTICKKEIERNFIKSNKYNIERIAYDRQRKIKIIKRIIKKTLNARKRYKIKIRESSCTKECKY